MKKITTLTLMTIFLVTLILPVQSVNALTINATESKINSDITNWVLDEPSNTLYAISTAEKKLLCINATTLVVENSLTLNGSPTDIIKDNGTVYIALDDVKQIAVVDIATRKTTKTLSTSSDPYRIVKNGNKLYYTELDQWCDIYEYDLLSNTDKVLSIGTSYSPDIAINKEKNLLYIGESGSSGSKMIYYSISEGKIISNSNYDSGYGFPYPQRSILFDGVNVFYAGRDFDADNATRIDGNFGNGEKIIFVKDDLIYTSKSIYSKSTHVKIGESASTMSLVEASSNTLYIYNNETSSIKRYNAPNNTINGSNIISLISGIETPKIQYSTESINIDTEDDTLEKASLLEIKSEITEWVIDEPTNTLYGISKDDKALFFINANTLNLEKSITFKSAPTDIIKDEDKLYIALDDANQIAIVDMAKRDTTKILYTSSDPYRIVKNGNKLYYTERDQWCNIYEYDLVTNNDKMLSIGNFYKPDIAINKEKNLLYIGESGSSSSDLIYYSISENKISSKSDGFSYPERNLLFDGENVFYDGCKFDGNAISTLGRYGGGNIIFTIGDYVYTSNSVYDKNSCALLESYEMEFNLIEFSSKAMYCYYQEYGIITIVEPDITAPVVEGVKNGNVYGDVTIKFNEGTATLDGKAFISGEKVTSLGAHVLEVVDKAGNSTIVKFTTLEYKKADVNKDGKVDILDLATVSKEYNKKNIESNWKDNLDINKDGIIDIFDIVLVAKNI